MRILFVFPRWEKFLEARPELRDLPYARSLDTFRVAPLSIPVLGALTPPGHEIEVLDDFTGTLDLSRPPDLAAVTSFTPQATRAYEIADALRAAGVPVVMGGIHPTVLPEEAKTHADAVVVGEAEGVWPRVLEDAARGALRPLYSRGEPADLRGLPRPRRDLFSPRAVGGISVVQTGRGCMHRCPTCPLPKVQGTRVRTRPVEDVVAEIRGLEAPAFYLAEESLLFPEAPHRAYAESLLDGIEGTGKSFFLASYPFLLERADPAFLKRLHRAGGRQIYLVFGVDDVGTDAFWTRAESVKTAVGRAREAGISLMGSFALGGDRDGPECFEKILAFARETEINLAEFFLLTPFPGTPLHDRFEAEGRILTREWKKYNGAHVVFRPRLMPPEELEAGYVGLWRAFYAPMSGYGSSLRFVRGFGPEVFRRAAGTQEQAAPGGESPAKS
ncbi:MAG: cobalamin-dependent protein [Planctomycetes bacterium]|nr:cobalamin-dependent protein [Planctomycetota bacterium]